MRFDIDILYLVAILSYVICLFTLIIKKKFTLVGHVLFLIAYITVTLKMQSMFPITFVRDNTAPLSWSLIPFKNILDSINASFLHISIYYNIIFRAITLSITLGFCIKYLFSKDGFSKSLVRFILVMFSVESLIIIVKAFSRDTIPYETSVFLFDLTGFVIGYFIAWLAKKLIEKDPNKKEIKDGINELYRD